MALLGNYAKALLVPRLTLLCVLGSDKVRTLALGRPTQTRFPHETWGDGAAAAVISVLILLSIQLFLLVTVLRKRCCMRRQGGYGRLNASRASAHTGKVGPDGRRASSKGCVLVATDGFIGVIRVVVLWLLRLRCIVFLLVGVERLVHIVSVLRLSSLTGEGWVTIRIVFLAVRVPV